MSKKSTKGQEDPKYYYRPKPDTFKCQEEFQNTTHVCVCVECGCIFEGKEESYWCVKCINEIY